MVKGLILYYLSIKSTHGYEIQKFIQVLKEERTGSRVRKIYEITDLGRKELEKEMRTELMTPIMETGSLKFVLYPMISVLKEKETKQLIEKHISDLEEKKKYWEYWREIKAVTTASRLTRLSFDMTIHTVEDQIAWHQELLHCLGDYRKESEDMVKMIKAFEPDSISEGEKGNGPEQELQEKLTQMERIKKSIEADPKLALEQLNEMMESIIGRYLFRYYRYDLA